MEQKAVVGKLENLSNHILEECEKRGLSICEMQMLGNFISNKNLEPVTRTISKN